MSQIGSRHNGGAASPSSGGKVLYGIVVFNVPLGTL